MCRRNGARGREKDRSWKPEKSRQARIRIKVRGGWEWRPCMGNEEAGPTAFVYLPASWATTADRFLIMEILPTIGGTARKL